MKPNLGILRALSSIFPDVEFVPAQEERRAPVQGDGWDRAKHCPGRPPGTVAWAEHLEAFEPYRKKYGNDQSAERIAERGGFSFWELTNQLGHEPRTWEPRT
jgi:hypothetical protein